MEGKIVILSLFLMSLLMAHIQVEAKTCCPNTTTRNLYNLCRYAGGSKERCASQSGCKIVDGPCPPPIPPEILGNSGDDVNEYCKVGCVSSVCSALTTLENSDASEIVNGAVDQCAKACSTFCTNGSMNAVETA